MPDWTIKRSPRFNEQIFSARNKAMQLLWSCADVRDEKENFPYATIAQSGEAALERLDAFCAQLELIESKKIEPTDLLLKINDREIMSLYPNIYVLEHETWIGFFSIEKAVCIELFAFEGVSRKEAFEIIKRDQ